MSLAISFLLGIVTLLAIRRARAMQLPPPPPDPDPVDRAEKVRRILKHLQRKPIGEQVEGSAYVLEGTVRAIDGVALLTSPYANSPCIGYHLDVRQIIAAHAHPHLDEARCVDFIVEDATGRVHVVSDQLELALTAGRPAWLDAVPAQLASRVPFTRACSVEEGVLRDGDRVLVCGVLTAALDGGGYRDGAPVYTLRGTPSFPLVASTDEDLFTTRTQHIAPATLHRR